MEEPDYLPISMLNQLEYCERRFYLMHVLGEMEVNEHVLEGELLHERAHSGGDESEEQKVTHRSVYVWSERLRVSGFCDVVEEEAGTGGGSARFTPVEYKKGRMGRWLNDHIQLCAQALCLEERMATDVERGYVFYFGSRRREEVAFTTELREKTVSAVQRARELIVRGELPHPEQKLAKCRDCSLQPVCLPREMHILRGEMIPRERRSRGEEHP
jgi:CRISPR-associated exonuclease Cas4